MAAKLDTEQPCSTKMAEVKFIARTSEGKLIWQTRGSVVMTDDFGFRHGKQIVFQGNATGRGIRPEGRIQVGALVIGFRPLASTARAVLGMVTGKKKGLIHIDPIDKTAGLYKKNGKTTVALPSTCTFGSIDEFRLYMNNLNQCASMALHQWEILEQRSLAQSRQPKRLYAQNAAQS